MYSLQQVGANPCVHRRSRRYENIEARVWNQAPNEYGENVTKITRPLQITTSQSPLTD